MIEIEKKFRLREGDEARLIEGAEFVSEKSHTDTYYDLPGLVLSTKDRWLRNRNGAWNLKNPLHVIGHHLHAVDQYEELEEEDEIRASLDLQKIGTLEGDLSAAGYQPTGTITTTRRKYRRGEFTIDLDQTDFGYALAEIELMIPDDGDREAAARRVMALAEQTGLDTTRIRGKFLEYLFRQKPEQYRLLVEAGIIWPDA